MPCGSTHSGATTSLKRRALVQRARGRPKRSIADVARTQSRTVRRLHARKALADRAADRGTDRRRVAYELVEEWPGQQQEPHLGCREHGREPRIREARTPFEGGELTEVIARPHLVDRLAVLEDLRVPLDDDVELASDIPLLDD